MVYRNKPAFILNLLMQEMLKPAHQRLEWIQWVDRDTLILDPCRPVSTVSVTVTCENLISNH